MAAPDATPPLSEPIRKTCELFRLLETMTGKMLHHSDAEAFEAEMGVTRIETTFSTEWDDFLEVIVVSAEVTEMSIEETGWLFVLLGIYAGNKRFFDGPSE